MTAPLTPTRLQLSDIHFAIGSGLALTHMLPGVSVKYAAVFAIIGMILLTSIGALGLSPMVLPFAGGFMLVGPILLTGYFALAQRHEKGERPELGDAFRTFLNAPAALWMLAVLCAFLFLIWITDAAVLYSFTIGGADLGYDLSWLPQHTEDLISFEFWGSLMGSIIAYMIFTVSAFSVPLIHDRRAGLVQAISASVRAVLGNFLVCLVWGILLGTIVILSVLVMPMLLFTLPVMSYASYALYRRAFPPAVPSA